MRGPGGGRRARLVRDWVDDAAELATGEVRRRRALPPRAVDGTALTRVRSSPSTVVTSAQSSMTTSSGRLRKPELLFDGLQVADELERTRLTGGGASRHRPGEHRLEARRNVVAPDRRNLRLRDPRHERRSAVVAAGDLEWASAGEQRVDRRPERPDLAGDRSGDLVVQHLGGRPRNREPDRVARFDLSERRGDAEVGEHRMAECRRQDVRRLDVAVQHALLVRGLDRARDADPDREHLGERQLRGPVALADRRRAVLHDEVGPAVGGDARLVDREDRRVRAQLGHEVRLGLEHLAHVVVHDAGEEHLDRDQPARHVLLVQEDVGESAGAEHAHEFEPGQVRRR